MIIYSNEYLNVVVINGRSMNFHEENPLLLFSCNKHVKFHKQRGCSVTPR